MNNNKIILLLIYNNNSNTALGGDHNLISTGYYYIACLASELWILSLRMYYLHRCLPETNVISMVDHYLMQPNACHQHNYPSPKKSFEQCFPNNQ